MVLMCLRPTTYTICYSDTDGRGECVVTLMNMTENCQFSMCSTHKPADMHEMDHGIWWSPL